VCLLPLWPGLVTAQEATGKVAVRFGGIGAPDGTNGIYMPRLVYSSNPVYADAAQQKGIQGRVIVGLVVNPDGTTSELRVLVGLDPDLDKAAVKAVTKWKIQTRHEG